MGPISRETKDWMSSAKRHLGITARKDGYLSKSCIQDSRLI